MKKVSSFLLALILTLSFAFVNASSASAGFVKKSSTITGYSMVGLKVLEVKFVAEGYSYSKSGSVKNMYFKDWAYWPNTISSRKTWKSHIPYGQKANGSVIIGVGINSPWGVANLWGGQRYFSLNF